MKLLARACLTGFVVLSLGQSLLRAEIALDRELLGEINAIKAIDNHAHPKRVVQEGESDPETDFADPVESPFDVPVRVRPDNPEFAAAQQALYLPGRPAGGATSAEEMVTAKKRVRAEQGDRFPAWVLDRLNIESMLANRVAMGRGLAAPRFLWVPYADAFLFPLDNTEAGAANPDYRGQIDGARRVLQRYARAPGARSCRTHLPATSAR